MQVFTPMASSVGGLLIGLASAMLLLLGGRVSGVSGIVGGTLREPRAWWRFAFVGGLVVGGAMMATVAPGSIAFTLDRSIPALVVAGLLVGFGTQLGSGCTSGHGVCGMSRGSARSIVATAVFVLVAIATATVVRVVFGGAL